MTVPTDVESHVMGYRDHSYRNVSLELFSNRVICTIEINLYPYALENMVLNHFPDWATICALGKYQSKIR